MKDQARDYQLLSLHQIRTEFSRDKRKVLLWLATGAGKTFIFCMMIKEAVSRGIPCMVLVRGRKLVDQASQRLLREHVEHGVFMAGHWNYRPLMPVQVCSVDTLISRNARPKAELIIIDEADLFTPDTRAANILHDYPDAFIVPVTATPWLKEGLSHLAETIVHPITMEELIEQDWLCGFKYYAPAEPDVSQVEVSRLTDDYKSDQLAAVMGNLTGNVIEHWTRLAGGRPTFLFAVNVKHSKLLASRFCEAGIPAEHCDADSSDKERDGAYDRLENGVTRILCNVGIAGRGVDVPCVSCIIMARPTRSRNLFVQQAGRGTRKFKNKNDCLLLDHAGNLLRHGFPTDEPDVSLEGTQAQRPRARETKICKHCFCAYRGTICPECGRSPPERTVALEESDEQLVELTNAKDPIKEKFQHLRVQARSMGKGMPWVYFKLKQEFGDAAKPYLPKYVTTTFTSSPYSRRGQYGVGQRFKAPQGGKT